MWCNLIIIPSKVGFGTEIIDEESRSRTIGGTIGYQSPEIYAAFKRRKP